MWYKVAQKMVGYKVVAYRNGKAYSLANPAIIYSLAIGSITERTYLGTNEKFCIDYYQGITDEQELLLTYSYDTNDVISGSDSVNGGEVLVRKARLEGYKSLNKT